MKKTLVRTPKPQWGFKSFSLRVRLGSAAALLALTTALGLAAERPARTAGGPIAVTVANTPLSAITQDSDNPARQPFAIHLSFNNADAPHYTKFTVPDGKRLVIQHVSVEVKSNKARDIVLETETSGESQLLSVPFAVTSDGMRYGGGPVTFYADPGTVVGVFFDDFNDTSPNVYPNVEIVGYYVNVP